MSVFDNLTKKVTETAKAAARKSGDIVEVTKLNVAIGTEEDKIQKEYAAIGKIVYDSFFEGAEVSDEIMELCQKIKIYEENIEGMKQKILDLKNIKICSGCASELETDIAFCPKCGAKQVIPEPVVEAPTEKKCSACEAMNELKSTFCSKCGNKLE